MSEEAIVEELRAAAHPLRLRILDLLKGGELNVGEIETASGIGQPTLSQQLAILRKAGLVETRKDAKLVFYRRDETRFAALAKRLMGAGADSAANASRGRRPSAGAANFARLS